MTLSVFIPLTKVDAKRREVWGVAAIEQPDRSREIMDYELSKPNFIRWSDSIRKASGGKSLGNVRDSHSVNAIGKVISLESDDATKAFRVGVKVVDDNAWKKVEEGVFTGFSIGGSYGKRAPDGLLKDHTRYEAIPTELSLVDVPCIPDAKFEFVKADGTSELRKHPGHDNQNVHDPTGEGGGGSDGNSSLGAKFMQEKKWKNEDGSVNWQGVSEHYKKLSSDLKNSNNPQAKKLAAEYKKKKLKMNSDGLKSLLEMEIKANNVFGKSLLGETMQKQFPPKKNETAPAEGDKEEEPKEETTPADKVPAGEGEQGSDQSQESSDQSQSEELMNSEDETSAADSAEDTAEGEMEAEVQPAAMNVEAVKQVVIQLLLELGLVQEQGGAMMMSAKISDMAKAADQQAILSKALDNFKSQIVGDLAKIAVAIDGLEKRGSGPVLREVGPITPQMQADIQRADLLKKMASETSNPNEKQLFLNEAARLEIKKIQNT